MKFGAMEVAIIGVGIVAALSMRREKQLLHGQQIKEMMDRRAEQLRMPYRV